MPLPPPDQLFDRDSYYSAWPMGAEKCELIEGVVVWSGNFIEEDADRARVTFPDRTIILWSGCIFLHPAGYTPPSDYPRRFS